MLLSFPLPVDWDKLFLFGYLFIFLDFQRGLQQVKICWKDVKIQRYSQYHLKFFFFFLLDVD